jgi:hypothetical protein
MKINFDKKHCTARNLYSVLSILLRSFSDEATKIQLIDFEQA